MPGPTSGRLNLNPRWPFWDTTRYAAAVDAAAAPQVYDKTGFATVGLVGTGAEQVDHLRTGAAIAGLVGSGVSVRPIQTANFDLGTNGATISTADAGDLSAWDIVGIGTGATATYDNTRSAHREQSAKLTTTGTAASARGRWTRAFGTDHYGRFYIYLTSYQTVGVVLCTNTSGTQVWSLALSASGQLVIQDATFVTKGFTTASLALNQWVRVEYHTVVSATTGSIQVKFFNNPDSGTPTETVDSTPNINTGADNGNVFFGISATANIGPLWLDSIVAAAPAYPGPDTAYIVSRKTGYAAVGTVGSGGSALAGQTYTKAGFATAGEIGAGGDVDIAVESGFAAVGGIGSGADADFTQETGFAVAGLVGTGASSSVFTRTGLAVAGLVASGPSASVFVEAGNASVNTVGAAPSESVTQETGAGVVGTVGAGFITRAGQTVKTGAGACGLVGAGTSASIYQETGPLLDAATVFLLHANGPDGSTIFPDAIGHPVTANGNAQVDTAQFVFGGASLLLDGTGDYLNSADSADWDLGAGDFTFDFWIRFPGSPTISIPLANYIAASKGWLIQSTTTGLFFFYSVDGTTALNKTLGNHLMAAATWYHIAVVRSGNNLKAYVNGNQVGTTQDLTGVTLWSSTAPLGVGAQSDGGQPLNGWLDEIRIVKGAALWTSNFTPPAAPYGTTAVGTVGTGTSESVFAKTGGASLGLVGVGGSASTNQETGAGTVGPAATGPSESVNQETGYATAGSVGSGFVTRAGQIVKTGAGACGLVGAGTSASIFTRLGNAAAGTVGTGGRARELARTGLGQVGTVGAGVALRAATTAKAGFATVSGVASGPSASLFAKLGYAIANLVGAGSETTTSGTATAKTGAGAAGTVGIGSSASIHIEAGSAAAVLVARGSRAVVYVQGGYAILSGTGTGVRTRTIARTGVGFLGVSGFGDNIEHFDAEPPGYVVGSHTGQPNRTTTGRRTVSIATILTSTGNGRLTRSKTGELV